MSRAWNLVAAKRMQHEDPSLVIAHRVDKLRTAIVDALTLLRAYPETEAIAEQLRAQLREVDDDILKGFRDRNTP